MAPRRAFEREEVGSSERSLAEVEQSQNKSRVGEATDQSQVSSTHSSRHRGPRAYPMSPCPSADHFCRPERGAGWAGRWRPPAPSGLGGSRAAPSRPGPGSPRGPAPGGKHKGELAAALPGSACTTWALPLLAVLHVVRVVGIHPRPAWDLRKKATAGRPHVGHPGRWSDILLEAS